MKINPLTHSILQGISGGGWKVVKTRCESIALRKKFNNPAWTKDRTMSPHCRIGMRAGHLYRADQ